MGSSHEQSLTQLLMDAARSDDPVKELENFLRLPRSSSGRAVEVVYLLVEYEIVMDVVSAIRQSSKTCWACAE